MPHGFDLVLLDGGLATELERRGCNLADPLWSARVLIDQPEVLYEVHRSYLDAGADVVATAGYQATFEGFAARGLSREEAEALIRRSVEIARRARDDWQAAAKADARRPQVAASIGPYGAFLHDGSEYRGDYGVGQLELQTFHADRLAILAESGADLLGCETWPTFVEVEAFLPLLRGHPQASTWISFTCRDPLHTSAGEPLTECARRLDAEDQVVAVGVNCLPPEWAAHAVAELRRGTAKPIVVYPNSGERWDARERRWEPGGGEADWLQCMLAARRAGASWLGGCCRTTPEDIRRLREACSDLGTR